MPSATMRCWPSCLVVASADRNWSLELDEVQMRQGHWAVVDLIGKGGHIRTVPIPNLVKVALEISGHEPPVSQRDGAFEPSPEWEKCGGKASHKMLWGMESRPAARERAWSILRRMSGEPVRSFATAAVVSLSRFNSYSARHLSRQRHGILAVNKVSGIR